MSVGLSPRSSRAIALLIVTMLACETSSHAAAGTEAASFLNIPVGAGPASLGSAYTPLASNAYATVWNPAGLAFIDGTQVAGQHLSYLESIHHEFLSIGHSFNERQGFGLSAQYLGTGSITGRDIDGIENGSYDSHWGAYTAAYGHRVGQHLGLGVSAKAVEAKIADVSAHAFAADLGALYRPSDAWSFAAAVTNIGTKLTFLNDGGSLPLTGKLGVAYRPTWHAMATAEVDYHASGLASGHVGFEWRPLEMVGIRAGYRTDTIKELGPLAGVSTGIGLYFWGHEFSYAWVPYGDLGSSQYFSLLLRFGGTEKDVKRELIKYREIKTHRTVMKPSKQKSEPDYQQLMEVLSDQDRELTAHAHGGSAR